MRNEMFNAPRPLTVLAVIVLYRIRPEDSSAYRSLLSSADRARDPLRVLLYDNTPGGQSCGDLPEFVRYYAAMRNEGVAAAYNYALEMAQNEGLRWLLTLDQDTKLPLDYLTGMRTAALRLDGCPEIAAIVPQLVQGERPLSPVRLRTWSAKPIPRGFTGVIGGELHAVNSASLFRVEALHQIGGFDPRFWLDFQDYSVFRRMNQRGMRVWVEGSIEAEHDLSLINLHKLNPARYGDFLTAESAFWDLYGRPWNRLALAIRLTGRWWRQRRTAVEPAIRRLTWYTLWRRVSQSRGERLRGWLRRLKERVACDPALLPSLPRQRPFISVCLAAYNGERYIMEQLGSILMQLGKDDEVIVVDDASKDGTRESVRSLKDPRITLIEHPATQGVVRTFEDAIRAARGEIAFLSDQDDLWLPDKVATVTGIFAENPGVMLVTHEVSTVNQDGEPLVPEREMKTRPFRSGLWANLIRNRYRGCTMAFRSSLRAQILPLPHEYDVLHDVWIGVRNALGHGATHYIERPLILYRRHQSTVTGRRKLNLIRQLRVRIDLLRALADFRRQSRMCAEGASKTVDDLGRVVRL
jgi:glycosyltransferase involved in cell wall biosynthesis